MTISWITIIPIVVIFILVINSIFVMYKIYPKLGIKTEKIWRTKGKSTDLIVAILVVVSMTAGFAVPKVAPASQLTQWINEYGMFIYLAWCFITIVVLSVILGLLGNFLKRDNNA